jgi:hypothetical protein
MVIVAKPVRILCAQPAPTDEAPAGTSLDRGGVPMARHTFRIVTRASDGSLKIRDFDSEEPLLRMHVKIGIDDCSTDLSLRGKPVFRGLVGPMPDGKGVARYESPDVFETLTREWTKAPNKRRRRRSSNAVKQLQEAVINSED